MALSYKDRILALEFVDEISDERNTGDGIWVYLKEGWINPNLEIRTVHEDTWIACWRELKHVIRKEDWA